jgi:hypothetical protein
MEVCTGGADRATDDSEAHGTVSPLALPGLLRCVAAADCHLFAEPLTSGGV